MKALKELWIVLSIAACLISTIVFCNVMSYFKGDVYSETFGYSLTLLFASVFIASFKKYLNEK